MIASTEAFARFAGALYDDRASNFLPTSPIGDNTMPYTLVLKYHAPDTAAAVRATIHDLSKQGLVKLDDAAMVSRGEDGKLDVHNEIDRGVKWGALIGGGIGLLVAGIFAPLAGVAIGALAGAGIGATTDMGISKSYVKEVGEALEPGQSALFMIVREGNADAVLAGLRQHPGEVLQTSLPPGLDASLRASVDPESMSPAERAAAQSASF
jgi:uncharacterized membrane protein